MDDSLFKATDRWLGTLLCYLAAFWMAGRKLLLRKTVRIDPESPHRILVIKFCCLGDAVLLIPALRNLKRNLPHSNITVLTTSRTSDLFTGSSYVNAVVRFPVTKDPLAFFRLWRELNRQRFDLVLTFDPWYRITALLSFLLHPKINAGFYFQGLPILKQIFTRSAEYTEKKHVVQTYLDLLRSLGLSVQDSHLEFLLGPTDVEYARAFFSDPSLVSPVVGVFPSSSTRWAARRWPADKFAQVADALLTNFGARVLILSGKGQMDTALAIKNAMHGSPVLAPDNVTVSQLAALMARCDLVVTGDSAPMHIAAAVGVPTVAIFSNVPHVVYHPYLDPKRYRLIRENIPCSPCVVYGSMPPCPFGYRCINEITAARVLAAIGELLPPRGLVESGEYAPPVSR